MRTNPADTSATDHPANPCYEVAFVHSCGIAATVIAWVGSFWTGLQAYHLMADSFLPAKYGRALTPDELQGLLTYCILLSIVTLALLFYVGRSAITDQLFRKGAPEQPDRDDGDPVNFHMNGD